MMHACPTVEYKGVLTFSYNLKDYYDQDLDPKEVQKLKLLFQLLRDIIKTAPIDFEETDQNGRSILSYAIHLCPFEVTQDIIGRSPSLLNNKTSESILKDFNNIEKDWGKTTFLNNDHRTANFLKEKGIAINKINFASFDVRNPILLQISNNLS